MQKTLHGLALVLTLFLMFPMHQAWSQCNNPNAFGTVTAPTTNGVLTMTTCTFGGEYNTINSAVAGSTYQFTGSGGTGNYLTVRQGSPSGTVLAFGFSPVNATCTVSGPLYLHVNTNAACGTESSCHTTTIQCTTCAGITNDVCSSAIPIACGQTISATTAGANIDAVGTCGTALNTAPGVWYSFVGDGQSTTLSLCGSSYDTKIGVFSGTCASLTCVAGNDDFCGTSSQVTFTSTAGTNYFVLVTGFSSGSGAFTLARTCTPPDPCASIPTMACATPVTASSAGTGAWSPNTCGFTTPGQEKLYSFTPGISGTHTLQVNSTNGFYVDYFYKAASGGCNSAGWICIGDAVSPESDNFGPLTAGTTYYIMYDPESTGTVTQTFQINCPAGAPPCIASPTSPTNGQTNICPSSTQVLSWPASASATSYDVYFGTTASPVFVGNTAATTFTVNTPTNSTYFWQILPRNSSGPATGCNVWSFTKIDVTAPTITCPASVTVNNSPASACSATATYGSISATDNCAAPSIVLQSGQASNTVFPVGVTTIVYRATDPSGNSSTCSFTVTVKDATPPTITCPANVVANNAPGLCSGVASYGSISATDNCAAPTITLVSGQASNTSFPVGVTTIVYRATDPSGNSSTCSFTVTIKDTEPPVVTCPGPVTLPNDAGQCGRAVNWLGQATFTDNCGAITNQNNSTGYFDVGVHTVTHTVTDVNGNSTTCSQIVTIYDQEFPSVICPSSITTKTDENDCVATVNFAAKVQDNCPGVAVSYSQDPMSAFDIGYSIVTAYATDASGHESSCNFQVRVDTRAEICNGSDDDCDGLTDEAEAWAKVAKMLAGDGGAQDQYGVDVDIDGEYAIVGSNQKIPGGQTLGAAYILHRGANGWSQSSKLEATGIDPGDQFGVSVAISGGIAVIGAPLDDDPVGNEGAVYIFYKNPVEDWYFLKKLKAADPDPADNFGVSVELDGDNLIVGANLDDESGQNAGAAYVFNRNLGGADNWGQVSKLLATTGTDNDNMGSSVAIDGNYAVVGATGVDGLFQNKGAAYVFKNSAGGWNQVARMSAPQSTQNDNFGVSVAVSGPWALVGANQNDLKGADAGAAFLFNKNQNGIFDSWGLKTVILDPNGSAGDHFGSGVGIDGDYAVISASGDNPFGAGSGRGFVYMRQENNWIQVDQLSDASGQANDNLGTAASISGRSIILGAPLDNNGGAADQGSAVIFEGICADGNLQQPSDRNVSLSTAEVRCYPVPFSDVLTIELRGISGKNAQVGIFNTLGQEVGNLYQGEVEGDMQFQWRPGANLMQGIYILRLNVDGKIISKTVTLAR